MNELQIVRAKYDDLKEILDLQYLAYQSEADLISNRNIPPLKQTIDELYEEYKKGIILKMENESGEIVGSIRAWEKQGIVFVGKLMVHPKYRQKGYGSKLLLEIEQYFTEERFELFTSTRSKSNIKLCSIVNNLDTICNDFLTRTSNYPC